MTNQELNQKVASALGWKQFGSRWHSPACQEDRENCGSKIPGYSENNGVALQALMEFADKHDLQWSLDKDCEHPGNVDCLLYAVEVSRDVHADVCAETPALAICKAIVAAAEALRLNSGKEK